MAREGGNERSSFLLFLVARLVSELHETMYNIQNLVWLSYYSLSTMKTKEQEMTYWILLS